MSRLSPLTVERIQPDGKKRIEHADGVVSGLYLVVQPSGVKSWAVRYRFDRKPYKHTLGRFPAVELSAARTLAKAALEGVDKGVNPAVRKKAMRPTVPNRGSGGSTGAEIIDIKAEDLTRESPVSDAWKGYLKLHLIPEATASSVTRFRGIFENHALPIWRNRPIGGMVKADALTVIDAALLRGRSAKNSMITVLSSFFNWCMDRNLIEHSPVERVKKIKMKSRKRKLSDDEIRIFWAGCDALASTIEVVRTKAKKQPAQFGPMFQLLLLTGCRRTEVAQIAREEVNYKQRIWTIPGERTKTGEEHKVYLCEAAVTILKGLPRVLGSKYFFSTTGNKPSSGFSKAKKRLDKVARLPHYTLHDLRRSFDTGCARIGIRNEVIERCLNHSLGVYNRHDYEKEMADAWTKWGAHVVGLVRNDLAAAA